MQKIISKEIREEVMEKVRLGERVTVLAKQYGISDKTVYTWLRKSTGEEVVSILKFNKLKRENEELKKLIGQLTLDMNLGKKIELVQKSNLKYISAEALGINRRNIYRNRLLPEKDLLLVEQIKEIHKRHPAYGHRRIAWHLSINHKRTQRVMEKFNIKPPRRKIIAARVGKNHDSLLVLATIKQAINTGNKPNIFHSDQGTEFMSTICTNYLEGLGIKISVSAKASPLENGYKESFFGRFKDEFGDFNRFETAEELIEEVYSQIGYYNNERIHTALKMLPAILAGKAIESCLQKIGT